MATFPDWCPTALQDLHQHFLMNPPGAMLYAPPTGLDAKWTPNWAKFLSNVEMSNLTYRWATHVDMEFAWEKIAEKADGLTNDAAFFICYFCISSIALYRADGRRSKPERRKHFARIAQLSSEVEQLLDDCLEFHRCGLSEFLSADDLDRLAHNVRHASLGKTARNTTMEDHTPLDLHQIARLLDISIPRGMRGIMTELSKLARAEAERPPLTSARNGKQAELSYLMRSLSNIFTNKFGKPMDGVVRAFAQAAYPKMRIEVGSVAKARQREAQRRNSNKTTKTTDS